MDTYLLVQISPTSFTDWSILLCDHYNALQLTRCIVLLPSEVHHPRDQHSTTGVLQQLLSPQSRDNLFLWTALHDCLRDQLLHHATSIYSFASAHYRDSFEPPAWHRHQLVRHPPRANSRTIKKVSAVRLSSAASQGYFYLLSICQPMDTKQETISVLELINFLLFWIYFFMFSLPSHDSLDPSYSFNSSSRTRWLSSIGRVLGISSAHYREDNARHQPTWSLKRYTSSNSYQRPCCWRYYLLSWL